MGDGTMILKAKIKSHYLKAILEGRKTMEFRQFGNGDRMEVTDENGHTTMLRITGASEANEELDAAVRMANKDVPWSMDEPIIVFRVEPLVKQ